MNKIIILTCTLILGSCQKKGIEFLGLYTNEELTEKIIKRNEDDGPILAHGLKPFYEIEYLNQEFSNVGVSLTELPIKNEKEGYELNGKKIWGYVFFNRDSEKMDCTEQQYKKYKDYFKLSEEDLIQKSEKPFWDSYLKDKSVITIICDGWTRAVVVKDYNALIDASANEKTRLFFEKVIEDMNKVKSRKI